MVINNGSYWVLLHIGEGFTGKQSKLWEVFTARKLEQNIQRMLADVLLCMQDRTAMMSSMKG